MMGKVKRFYTICLLMVALYCVFSCGKTFDGSAQNSSAPQSTPTVQNTPTRKEVSVEVSAIKDVIQSKREYFCTVYGYNILLKDFHSGSYMDYEKNEYYNPDEDNDINHVYSQFCIIDLDGDGISEVILESETTQGNELIFHYEDGVVYGFVFPFRGMKRVKVDATFEGSSSAAVTVIGKISFLKGKVVFNELCLFDGLSNVFRINMLNVSQEEVEEYLKMQDEKEDIPWYEYSEENLEKYFVGD